MAERDSFSDGEGLMKSRRSKHPCGIFCRWASPSSNTATPSASWQQLWARRQSTAATPMKGVTMLLICIRTVENGAYGARREVEIPVLCLQRLLVGSFFSCIFVFSTTLFYTRWQLSCFPFSNPSFHAAAVSQLQHTSDRIPRTKSPMFSLA